MCYCGVLGCKIVANCGMSCLVAIAGECHRLAIEVLNHELVLISTPATPPANERKWEGSQPRLRSAGGKWLHKRKNGRFSGIGQPFFLVIFVLQERSKGTSGRKARRAKSNLVAE